MAPSVGEGGPGDSCRELPEGGGGKPPRFRRFLEIANLLKYARLPEVTGRSTAPAATTDRAHDARMLDRMRESFGGRLWLKTVFFVVFIGMHV